MFQGQIMINSKLIRVHNKVSKTIVLSFFCMLISSTFLKGQSDTQSKIDSLELAFSNSQEDHHKLQILEELTKFYSRKDTRKSAKYAQEYVDIAKKIADHKLLSNGYRRLGDMNRFLGEYKKAEEDYKNALAFANLANDKKSTGMTYSSLSYLYKRQGKYPESLQASLTAVELIEKLGEEKMLPRAYHTLASVYSYMANRETSLKYYLKAARINEKLGNQELLGLNYSDIANLYLVEENYEEAEGYLLKSLELIHEGNVPRSLIPPLVNIGIVYLETDRKEQAIASFQKALIISQDLKDPQKTGYCLDKLGDVYKSSGKFQKAIDLYDQSLLIWKEIGDLQGIANSNFMIGVCLKNLGQLNNGIKKMKVALDLISQTGFRLTKADMLKELSDTYAKTGNYKLAFEHHKMFKSFQDSVFNRENEDKISDLRAEYDTEKKEQQIDLQLIQLGEQTAVIAQQKAERNILITIALFIVLIACLIYYFYHKVKKSNHLINEQNVAITQQKKLIEKSLGERETLLKEIHHRVKNNLQIIASLLQLQSGRQTDRNTKRLLEEGQGRVKSMALIHQKLYENEDLKNIPFSEYLKDLILEIKKSFGSKAENIEIIIESDHIFFDIDKAIPLGLIINELTTNSFKYAYQKSKEGKLNVTMKKEANKYVLEISDNGGGLPQSFDFSNAESLGLKLVRILSLQLEGEYNLTSDQGTIFKLNFAA